MSKGIRVKSTPKKRSTADESKKEKTTKSSEIIRKNKQTIEVETVEKGQPRKNNSINDNSQS